MERVLSIDCPRMVLRKNSAQSDRVYEGPGSIYQTNEGELTFKLYASGPPDDGVFTRIIGAGSVKSGQIIPHDEYFTLEAASLSGDIWRGDFILPEFNQGVEHGPVIVGSLYELTSAPADPYTTDVTSCSLGFAGDFEFPTNTLKTTKTFEQGAETSMAGDWMTVARFDAAGLAFRIQRDSRGVFLSAKSNGVTLPCHFDMRICEALQFTLFESLRWVVRRLSGGGQISTTLRPFPKERTKNTARPPN